MARKRKPSVSSYERRQWLEELEKGKGITEISGKAGRDIRVVKRHIDIARQERESSLARHDFLVSRLEQHQQDLLDGVRRIHSVIDLFPPQKIEADDPIEQLVHKGLNEHLNDLSTRELNEGLQKYNTFVIKFDELRHNYELQLLKKEKKLIAKLSSGLNLYPWTPNILKVFDAGGSSDRSYTENKQEDGTYRPSWGAYSLTESPIVKSDLDKVLEAHRKLTLKLKSFKTEVQKIRQQYNQLISQLVDKLDVLLVRRMVPGHCQYCPF